MYRWWTSVIIRHAQQMNIHREPAVDDPSRDRLNLGLRRRIWWTAFVSLYPLTYLFASPRRIHLTLCTS